MVVAVHENEGVAPRHHLVAHRLEDRLAAQLLRIVAVLHVFLGDRDLCLADEVVEVLLVEILAGKAHPAEAQLIDIRSEEHTSELQSLMRISYAVFCLKKKNTK